MNGSKGFFFVFFFFKVNLECYLQNAGGRTVFCREDFPQI